MIVNKEILDELTSKAKESTWLRMNHDLRNAPEGWSQRILNAIEPGTVLPVHRHRSSNETCICLKTVLLQERQPYRSH